MKKLIALLACAVLAAVAASAAQTLPATQPTTTTQTPAPAEPPNRYEVMARQIVDNFNAGNFDAARKDFDDTLKRTATPAVLKSVSDEVRSAAGAFKSITSIQTRLRGYVVIDMVAAYEKAPVAIQVAFDTAGRVGAVTFNPIVDEKIDPALEQIGREFIKDVTSGRVEEASRHFDAPLRAQMPPKTLAELGANLNATFGPFQSVKSVSQKTLPKETTLTFTTAFEFAPVKATVVFNAKKKLVVGVSFKPANAK